MSQEEIEELERLADDILVEDDPHQIALQIAESIDYLHSIAGFSTRINAMATTLADFYKEYADAGQ